jgi:TPR repeat protein
MVIRMLVIVREHVVSMDGDVGGKVQRLSSTTGKSGVSAVYTCADRYRKAAVALHPGAMYRLGTAELNGHLGLSRRPREGVKWLKRSVEHATEEFPHAFHELARIHEEGIENIVFVDFEYTVELLASAAELGYAPSAFKLGEIYEYGRLGCPQDQALSIHFYVGPATFSCR